MYVVPREVYGKPLYQESVAVLAAGSLETITETVGAQLQAWSRAE
jgi:hypothetical protein